MADVTFGVKVPEEMKNELTELMKNTQLTGKEFMSLLLSVYKLERTKQTQNIITSDINELQRLLQRIQHLYLHIGERANLLLEEELLAKDEEIKQILNKEEVFKKQIEEVKDEVTLKDEIIEKGQVILEKKDEEIEALKKVIDDYKLQIEQSRSLGQQYEVNICGLKERINELERFETELLERQQENQRVQTRNDELASEIWFLQREKEKHELEITTALERKEDEIKKLTIQYELELKNNMLEQKVKFNEKMELLKEEHYRVQQQQTERIQNLLMNKKMDVQQE